MRSVDERIERAVCAGRCRYFKPWKEPGRCGAFRWLRSRASAGSVDVETVERLVWGRAFSALRHDTVLLRAVCIHCVHYRLRCPYRSSRSGSEPCGGVAVLDLLIERGDLDAQALFETEWSDEGNPG